jgi:hypothetical protein
MTTPRITDGRMSACRDCGSMAINPHCHGREPEVDLDLCDVCYWRTRAARIADLDSQYKAEVLDYERRLAEMMNEASVIEAERDAALARVAELEGLVYSGGRSHDAATCRQGSMCPWCEIERLLRMGTPDHLAGAGKKVPR